MLKSLPSWKCSSTLCSPPAKINIPFLLYHSLNLSLVQLSLLSIPLCLESSTTQLPNPRKTSSSYLHLFDTFNVLRTPFFTELQTFILPLCPSSFSFTSVCLCFKYGSLWITYFWLCFVQFPYVVLSILLTYTFQFCIFILGFSLLSSRLNLFVYYTTFGYTGSTKTICTHQLYILSPHFSPCYLF